MITQVFYSIYGQHKNVWSTTYSDDCYRVDSRKHLMTRVKPTKRQVRHLHKQKEQWVDRL